MLLVEELVNYCILNIANSSHNISHLYPRSPRNSFSPNANFFIHLRHSGIHRINLACRNSLCSLRLLEISTKCFKLPILLYFCKNDDRNTSFHNLKPCDRSLHKQLACLMSSMRWSSALLIPWIEKCVVMPQNQHIDFP